MMQTSNWGELFQYAISILEQASARVPIHGSWTFGGGTSLMLQIGHRESFDIDLFLDDPQLLPYLNPETQGFRLPKPPNACQTDGLRVLKVVFSNVGEIDFICAPPLTDAPTRSRDIAGQLCLLDTPAEIVAKKVFYRGASLQPRDMFDIACVMEVMGRAYLEDALRPFADRCAVALKVAKGMDDLLAKTVMRHLLIREPFTSVPEKAQAETIDLMSAVIAGRR
ncbi:nucleotidyl transferase AbiEii/AbiGii toxin family protein [Rhizobium sp. SG2393]|uniref:nucleotidyl transferase AbiEii/AbiGii toxin family protein n=1 Tax=Rhizobium sp. SG2393 TaxID=3276279 RepID=UPI00366E0BF6